MESAPILIKFVTWGSISCNKLPNTFATLHGRYKLEATWMTDHIEHSKNKWLIVSSLWQNMHFVISCQFCFRKVVFVKDYFFAKILEKNWSSVVSSFSRIFLLLSTQNHGLTSALYMEPAENLPLSCRFHWNSSNIYDSGCLANWSRSAFHDASMGPIKSCMNSHFVERTLEP
jgi:hypothetical protein